MGDFSAVFVKVDGLDETDLGFHHLGADTLKEAKEEARALPRPLGANSIKICREGQKVHQIGVDL